MGSGSILAPIGVRLGGSQKIEPDPISMIGGGVEG
jgi:hypothetical protein